MSGLVVVHKILKKKFVLLSTILLVTVSIIRKANNVCFPVMACCVRPKYSARSSVVRNVEARRSSGNSPRTAWLPATRFLNLIIVMIMLVPVAGIFGWNVCYALFASFCFFFFWFRSVVSTNPTHTLDT
jgi:hypothetical protein